MVIEDQESPSSAKEMGDVTLTFKDDGKIPAHSIILSMLPCDLCSKTFPKEKARDIHKKKTHNIDNIEYTPGPVTHKSWFYCKQCPIKRNTEKEIEIHTNRMHKHIKRNLSEMKKGQIQRAGSVNLSPPQKKPKQKLLNSVNLSQMQKKQKKKLINSETNTELDDSEYRMNNLVKKNESLNILLINREEQIQKQANQISDMKSSINNTKEVINDTNVEMLKKDIYVEERNDYIRVMETKVEELNTIINNQKRRMELVEDESRKLAEESKFFKKENEVASKHLIDMDKVNQERLQQLKNTIEKQVYMITVMTKELDKYTIPKDTQRAQIVTPPAVPDALEGGEAGAASTVINGEGMEEDETEIDQIHGDKIAGYRREGPQNGARPKEVNNKDVQPKHKFNCTECPETR